MAKFCLSWTQVFVVERRKYKVVTSPPHIVEECEVVSSGTEVVKVPVFEKDSDFHYVSPKKKQEGKTFRFFAEKIAGSVLELSQKQLVR